MCWHTLGLPTSTTTHNSRILDVTIIKYPPQATLSDTYLNINIFQNCFHLYHKRHYVRSVDYSLCLLKRYCYLCCQVNCCREYHGSGCWESDCCLCCLSNCLLLLSSCFHLHHLLPVVKYRRRNQ